MAVLTKSEKQGLSKSEIAELQAKKDAEEEAQKKENAQRYEKLQAKKLEDYRTWAVAYLIAPIPYVIYRILAIVATGVALNVTYGRDCGQNLPRESLIITIP